jgi:hypothetical protein
MHDGLKPKLRFAREFTEQDAFEAQSRGYLSHVLADFGGGRLFPLFFYDVERLKQDLEENARHGHAFIADPGMIIVVEITLEAMEQAIDQASREGFFDHLSEITADDLASNGYQWPPTRARRANGPVVESNKVPTRA